MGSIITTLVIFAVIILIHELGHFTAAKLSGVRVNEFSLGMGPALFRFETAVIDRLGLCNLTV